MNYSRKFNLKESATSDVTMTLVESGIRYTDPIYISERNTAEQYFVSIPRKTVKNRDQLLDVVNNVCSRTFRTKNDFFIYPDMEYNDMDGIFMKIYLTEDFDIPTESEIDDFENGDIQLRIVYAYVHIEVSAKPHYMTKEEAKAYLRV